MKNKHIALRRCLAFLFDWLVIFIICIALFLSGPQFDPEYLKNPSIRMFSAYGLLLGLAGLILLPLFKDCFGASLGKFIFGIRVYDAITHRKPKISKLILRNIPFYFPLIELIFLLANHGKTLGDMLSESYVDARKKKQNGENRI